MTMRHSKTPKPKGHKTSRAAKSRRSAAADLRKQLDRQTRELAKTQKLLTEALQQQTASAEVLKVISRSAFDLEAVLQTLVESAAKLCNASSANIRIRDGDMLRPQAFVAASKDLKDFQRNHPIKPGRGNVVGRAFLTGELVHVPDVLSDPEYELVETARMWGYRAVLAVPMVREGRVEGVFSLVRTEPGPYSDREIGLVRTFVDQALIAIENVRLFNETRKALERQTATAEILRVIAASPSDLQPVFEAIAARSVQLVGGHSAAVSMFVGDRVDLGAFTPVNPEADAALMALYPRRLADYPLFELVHGGEVAQVSDMETESRVPPLARATSRARGFRSMLLVPMNSEKGPIGVITVTREEPGTFEAHHIQLLQTFADQAVIAIKNARLFDEVQTKTRDLEEALVHQTGSANILNVIAMSPTDIAPVLQAIVQGACELCNAADAAVTLKEGDQLRFRAHHGSIPVLSDLRRINRSWVNGRAVIDKTTVHVHDLFSAEGDEFPEGREMATPRKIRTVLSVPLLRKNDAIGTIMLRRIEVHPFSDKQIALLRTFADQAVIAIENARLFNETQEALERQTATAEVLQVINSSQGDLAPIFEMILEKAHSLCAVALGTLLLYDGEKFRAVAVRGFPETFAARLRQGVIPGPNLPHRRLLEGARFAQVTDWAEIDDPIARASLDAGARTSLFIPLRREGALLGYIAASRGQVRPFTEKEISLLESFAAQAVIAMENARLLGELRERTADLARSVDELTATSDVLKIISRSTVDLVTVLDTLVETAARLCHADQARMYRRQGDHYYSIASHGFSPENEEWLSRNPIPKAGRGTAIARAAAERCTVHIADVLADPEYTWEEGQRLAGYRTVLAVPLLRGETLIGLFSLLRARVAPFMEKEIELVTTFADQAVIAIENARLFEELRDRQAELRVTFDNMGDGVVMFGPDTRLVAWNRNFQTILDLPDAFLARRPSYIEYFQYLAERGEYSTDLEAELGRRLHETDQELRLERTRPDGRVIEARRNPVPGGGFVLIYADITERKRAEEAVRAARDAAESALRDLQTAQDRLVQTEKLASLGQLTAGIAHEIKNPLNFVNNFSALSVELTDELSDLLKRAALADQLRKEVDELTALLKSNLEKVVQHGKRADSIVKNMLLHSRQGSGERRSADINALVDEALNLAYHGARAEKQGFHITLERDFDLEAGRADFYPQEVTRVLLNLISNGFYAAAQRATGNGFEPTLKAVTRNLGDKIEIRIRDNGMGIPPDIRDKIFNPFFTTKPAGEGTGLGLSMSHDIVVKQHGGTIEVQTEPGSFTEFIITLPRVLP